MCRTKVEHGLSSRKPKWCRQIGKRTLMVVCCLSIHLSHLRVSPPPKSDVTVRLKTPRNDRDQGNGLFYVRNSANGKIGYVKFGASISNMFYRHRCYIPELGARGGILSLSVSEDLFSSALQYSRSVEIHVKHSP